MTYKTVFYGLAWVPNCLAHSLTLNVDTHISINIASSIYSRMHDFCLYLHCGHTAHITILLL